MAGTKETTEGTPAFVEYHYIKSNQFRVIHADGAHGGVTARGYLHIAFFSERRAIPRMVSMAVDVGAGEAREVDRESLGGVVREVEADVVLDETAVKELVAWLNSKLDDFRRVRDEIAKIEAEIVKK